MVIKKLVMITLLAILIGSVAVCYAADWQEITTFTGATDQTTDYFNVPTIEWRITWSITPDPDYPQYSELVAYVYHKGESALYVGKLTGNDQQINGTLHVHEGAKDYYIKIITANLQNYNLKVEYDTTAPIPEFSTISAVALLCAVAVAVLTLKMRRKLQE